MAVQMEYVYILFTVLFLLMAAWMYNRVKSNRQKYIEENSPAIAGSDSIKGSIENDGRYDEPTSEDLEQMEKLLEEISFSASDIGPTSIKIDTEYVEKNLGELIKSQDLSKFIL